MATKEENGKNITVVETCPQCGSILIEGIVLNTNGEKTPTFTCKKCKRIYHVDGKNVYFRPLNGKRTYTIKPGEQVKLSTVFEI